jgi:CheY-like chemotaxis protein
MNKTMFRILHVEDETQLADQIRDFFQAKGRFGDIEVTITRYDNIEDAKVVLDTTFFDLIILDLRLAGENDGTEFLNYVKNKRFVPVVFYTGLAGKVREETLVRVVLKDAGGLERLRDAVNEIIKEGISQFQTSLRSFVENSVKDYMWDFVNRYAHPMKKELFDENAKILKKLVLRRLAAELRETNTVDLFLSQSTATLSDRVVEEADPVVQPIEFYIIPPIFKYLAAGDVLSGKIGGEESIWVVLHPTCDMIQRADGQCKAEYVTVAKANPLTSFAEYNEWEGEKSKSKIKALQKLIHNSKQDGQAERFWFLPGTLNIPHSVVDFQQIKTDLPDNLMKLDKVASLDSPFAENLLTSYSRYKGRIGQPRINADYVLTSLQPAVAEKQVAAGTKL